MIRTAMFAAVVVCAGSLAYAQHITHSAPWLGKPLNLAVDGLPPGAPCWLFASTTGADVPTPFGTLGIDLASAFSLFAGDADAHGRVSVVVPVPEKIGLAELPLHVQAFYVDPSAPAGGALVPAKGMRLLGSRVYLLAQEAVGTGPVRLDVYSSPTFDLVFSKVLPIQTVEGNGVSRLEVSGDGSTVAFNNGYRLVSVDNFFGAVAEQVSYANLGMWRSLAGDRLYFRHSGFGPEALYSVPFELPASQPTLLPQAPPTKLAGFQPGRDAAWFRLSSWADQLVDLKTGDIVLTVVWNSGINPNTNSWITPIEEKLFAVRWGTWQLPYPTTSYWTEVAHPGVAPAVSGPAFSTSAPVVQHLEGTSRFLLQGTWLSGPGWSYDVLQVFDIDHHTTKSFQTSLPYRLLGPSTSGTHLAYVKEQDGRLYRLDSTAASIQPLGGPDLPWATYATSVRDFSGERVAFVGCVSTSCSPLALRPIAFVDPTTLDVIQRESMHTRAMIFGVSIPKTP